MVTTGKKISRMARSEDEIKEAVKRVRVIVEGNSFWRLIGAGLNLLVYKNCNELPPVTCVIIDTTTIPDTEAATDSMLSIMSNQVDRVTAVNPTELIEALSSIGATVRQP